MEGKFFKGQGRKPASKQAGAGIAIVPRWLVLTKAFAIYFKFHNQNNYYLEIKCHAKPECFD